MKKITIGVIGIILVTFVATSVNNQIRIEMPENSNKTLPPLGSGEVKPAADLWKIKEKCDIAQNRREYEDCLGNELNKLNTRLNEEFEASMKNLKENNPEGYNPDKDIDNLNKTQKIWFSYREMHCISARDLYGGGLDGGSASLECRISLTIERIRAIQVVYNNK